MPQRNPLSSSFRTVCKIFAPQTDPNGSRSYAVQKSGT
jgi:hypothetical protein